mmetsp:Transcript_20710/g.43335  ORF Transcript_20710/g.43335 Transcript_20710/m.43335 type:complete len:522 (+) Transcript_20710:1409-2974(+)
MVPVQASGAVATIEGILLVARSRRGRRRGGIVVVIVLVVAATGTHVEWVKTPLSSLYVVGGKEFLGHRLLVVFVLSAEHAGVALDEEKDGKEGRRQGRKAHDGKGVLVVELPEADAKADGAGVPAGTDDAGDRTGGGRIDVGDDPVGRSLRSLDKEGEEDHHQNRRGEGGGLGEKEDQGSLGDETQCLDPQTAPHPAVGVGLVGAVSTEAAGKEVEPPKDAGDRCRGFRFEIELVLEVQGGGVVHGQLGPEAAGVLQKEDPGVDVADTLAEKGGRRSFLHRPVSFEIGVVPFGTVVADLVDHQAGKDRQQGGDDADEPPGLRGVPVENDLKEGKQAGTDHQLCDAAAEVSPSSDQGVGGTDDLLGKHPRGPVLAHDKGAPRAPDEQPKDGETHRRVDKSRAGGGDRAQDQHHRHGDSCPPLVAGGSQHDAHKDGPGDAGDVGGPDFLVGELEVVADLAEDGGDGKPDEKGDKEAPPGAVKGHHVGPCQRAELDLRGLVVLFAVDGDIVVGIFSVFVLRVLV